MTTNIINAAIFKKEHIILLKEQYQQAKPYRHIVIDNFLQQDHATALVNNFPSMDQLSIHYKGLNESKSEGSQFELYNNHFSILKENLASVAFTNFVEEITGIPHLFTTSDNLGSGIHLGKNGSYLDIHIDFNIHHKLNLHRRLNLLVFLNPDWKDEYGGKLELWNADVSQCEQMYMPVFNRCVIFETNEISYHGYGKITTPEDITRKSFYTYYYTQIGAYKGRYHDTVFKARPQEGLSKKVKTDVKEFIKNNAKRILKKFKIQY